MSRRMKRICAAKWCYNSDNCPFTRKLSFFNFPKDESRAEKWRKFCQIDVGSQKSSHRVCSEHFNESDFKALYPRKLLHWNVVPSVIMGVSCNQPAGPMSCDMGECPDTKLDNISSCSVSGCQNNASAGRLFQFPRVLERAQLWREFCGIDELQEIPIDQLCYKAAVCKKHFRVEDFQTPTSEELNGNAVPTLHPPFSALACAVMGCELKDSKQFYFPHTCEMWLADGKSAVRRGSLPEDYSKRTTNRRGDCLLGNTRERLVWCQVCHFKVEIRSSLGGRSAVIMAR